MFITSLYSYKINDYIYSKMNRLVKVWQVGRINYRKALQLQRYLAKLHHSDEENPNTLLLVEHNPVYTTGIRSKQYTLEEESKLKHLGADFYRADRGGLITFHGPGQLVVYPIINLNHFTRSIRWYVNSLEETIIRVCDKFNLKASRSPHTGVWIGENKICAIGVHNSRCITTHGLALNCSIDLNWFNHIVPCGIEGKGVTSLTNELNRTVDLEEAVPIYLEYFSDVFKCTYTNFPKEEANAILNYESLQAVNEYMK